MWKLGKLVYWWLLVVIVIALATPWFQLLGELWQAVLSIKDWNADQSEVLRAIWMVVTIILIAAVLIPFSDNFKSPLYYGLRNLWYSIDKFSEEKDVEAKKQILQRAFAYWAYLFVIFIIYAYLVWSLKNNAAEAWNMVSVLSFVWLISVIALWNTWWVAQLVAKNGDVIVNSNWFELQRPDWMDETTQWGSNLLLVLIIIIANVVLLSIWLLAKNNVENFLTESWAWDVLEGNAEWVFWS